MIRPPRLEPGDLVALVAPAGPVTEAQAADAATILESWGLRTHRSRHALGRRFFLSGTDDERLADLEASFRDPEVRGILCIRGGYGTQRIVDRLDYDAVRADPKLVIGFSDITALHLALWHEAGLATVHGPSGSALINDPVTTAAARQAVTTTTPLTILATAPATVAATAGPPVAAIPADGAPVAHSTTAVARPAVPHAVPADADTSLVRHPGRADGTLLGGNLTLLAATAGTRHQPDLTGAILLIEEVNEAAFRVDRMIVQLKRSGWFDGLAGVAVGSFTACPDAGRVLAEHLNELGIPVLAGLPIGHGPTRFTVPLGVPAHLDADTGTLTVQPAVR
ncbi:S66 peptidase family protein [Actinoplanes xinjiangensis]|uniref:S66 peptidase family protein n=1 Tax=Actinoplanes xinjiangensis TaxID=512350 RepID=UPI00342FF56A